MRRWYACRNKACARHRDVRDGQGICQTCGWQTVLAVIDTWRR